MWRWLVCFALAILAIAISQLHAQSLEEDDERDRIRARDRERRPEAKPPPIDGWIIIEICSVTGKLDHPFSEWAYVRPEAIIGISNPVSTPEDCVAITSASNRRIYIKGTLEGIAALVTERIK